MTFDAREHSLNILNSFRRKDQRLNTVQETYFRRNKIPDRDRQRITVLTREVIRWKGRLDLWIQSLLEKPISKLHPMLLIILELAAYEILMDKTVPDYAATDCAVSLAKKRVGDYSTGLVNAVLRKLKNIDPTCPPDDGESPAWFSTPDWIFNRWQYQFGDEKTHNLCDYNNLPSQLTIRRNVLKISDHEFCRRMETDGISLERFEDSSRFYLVNSGGQRLRMNVLFQEGGFSFQDRSAGAVVELLDPQEGETIIDVCAAPGTKSVYIAERIRDHGKVLAYDRDPDRVKMGSRNDDRHGLRSIIWAVKDAVMDEYPMADRILVDAPCTGTGVIRRRPDIKWRRRPEHLIELTQLQLRILQNVCKFLKLDGVMIYATCSLEREENWQVVEAFLKLNNQFKVEKIKNPDQKPWITAKGAVETFPPRDHRDGIFAVKLRYES